MKRHLIIVDVQNDFCPGGSLAVGRGRDIISNINKLTASGFFDTIIATQDWHPEGHCSFGEWPEHCVQDTWGADLHKDLNIKPIQLIARKGMKKDVDSYSALYENDGTETRLGRYYIPSVDNEDEDEQEFYIVGIATEVCVKFTALDFKKDFETDKVIVLFDACASLGETSFKESFIEMSKAGIEMLMVGDVLK
jgi:nicotinamidase/pyrazinamidase